MRALAIGAHPDDIELGCGGALLAHVRAGHELALLVMTTGECGPQDAVSRIQEQEDAAAILGARLFWGGFADCNIPGGRAPVDVIQSVIREVSPDVIYTHVPRDTHQDHRATGLATAAAARRANRVLMYEAPTTEAFAPSVFIDVAGLVEAKLDLIRAHVSQVLKNGLVDLEAVEAQARYRGFQARKRNAEAYECERFLWDPAGAELGHPALPRQLEDAR